VTKFVIALMLGLLLAASAVALAAPGPMPDEVPAEKSEVDLLRDVVSDLRAHDWRQATSGVIFLLMAVAARFRDRVPFFRGDRGGALLLLAMSALGGVATALLAEASVFSAWFLLGSVWTAVGAAGIHALTTRILWPKDGKQWLAFLKPLLQPTKKVAAGEVPNP